jgi:hypothetical protein
MNDLENPKPAISASLAYLENDNNKDNNIICTASEGDSRVSLHANCTASEGDSRVSLHANCTCKNDDNNVINDNISNDNVSNVGNNNNNGSEKSNEVINEIINIKNKDNAEYKTYQDYKDYKENDDINDSCALDIIAVYLKGQKNIYMESKLYCQQILNILMLPAIFISALSSVLSLSFDNYEFNPILISSLNGFNTFLLSLISYLKLDAKAEAHRMSSDKFDNLQSQCEFKSGQVLLFDIIEKKSNLNKFLETIEKEVIEIKSTNQFIIPERIRNKYIYTYSTNVFALVKELIIEQKIKKQKIDSITKKIKNYKNNILEKEKYESIIFNFNEQEKSVVSYNNKLDTEEKQKLYINTLDNITHQKKFYNQKIINITDKLKDYEDINVLKLKKEELLNEYLEHSKKYMEIDADFKLEIQKNTKNSCNLCQWLKT